MLVGDVGQRVRELVRQTCDAFEIRIIKGVVSKDHVHILVSAPPEMAPSEMMRRIKGRTARKRFEEVPALKQRYWGRHFGARGYFGATVGEMTEEMIQEYLEHHFEPDLATDFKVEPYTGLGPVSGLSVLNLNPPALAGGCLVLLNFAVYKPYILIGLDGRFSSAALAGMVKTRWRGNQP